MNPGFCDHLDDYGVLFGRAQASYENCVHLLDKIIENMADSELRRTLEKALDEWVSETRRLQSSYEDYVKAGTIKVETSGKGQKMTPEMAVSVCSECSFRVPRLTFPEFELSDNHPALYRGKELPGPVIQEATPV